MQIEYHQWWSPNLQQKMELKVYGYYGKPILIFPAQGGRFFEFEDFGMISAIHQYIETGKVKVYTVDSIDNQSWANFGIHPGDRAWRHEDYDRYIMKEVTPFIYQHCPGYTGKFITTGCSMGGYHAANFFFRHPDIFDTVISLSGLLQLTMFVGDYTDNNVYFNSPLFFLPNLEDSWYINQYRDSKIIICVGQGAWEEDMIRDANELKAILEAKSIPAWIDYWGYDVNHDWPWWRKQLPYYLDNLEL